MNAVCFFPTLSRLHPSTWGNVPARMTSSTVSTQTPGNATAQTSPLTLTLCFFPGKFQNGFRKAIIALRWCAPLLNQAFNNIRWNFNELRLEIGSQQQQQQQKRRQWWNKVTPKWRFNKQNVTTQCYKWLPGCGGCSLIIFWSSLTSYWDEVPW